MGNAQILNLESAPLETPEPESKPVVAEFTQARHMIEEARSDVQRLRRQVERQADEQDAYEKRIRMLFISVAALIILFAGIVWFGYPTLANGKKTIADVSSLQNISNALTEQLNSFESNLKKMSADFPALSGRVDQLQASMKTNLQVARNQAQAVAVQAGKRLREDMDQSLHAIQSRLSGLESNQKESTERVLRLQEQVTGMQQEVARMREQNSAASKNTEENTEAAKRTGPAPAAFAEPDPPDQKPN